VTPQVEIINHASAVRRSTIVLATLSLASAAPDPAPLDAWLRQQASVRSLESEFVQERTLPSLKNPVTTKGRLWFRHPGFVRWELGQPPSAIAVSDGSVLTTIDTIDKRAQRRDLDDPQARAFTLLAAEAFRDRDAFHRSFELHDSRVVESIYQATLRPLDRRLRDKVPWIIIDLDTSLHRLRAIEMHFKDESKIRSIFSSTRLNPAIPDTRFHLDLTGYRVR
jgi:outer membrane lipoprotein-sorting protein